MTINKNLRHQKELFRNVGDSLDIYQFPTYFIFLLLVLIRSQSNTLSWQVINKIRHLHDRGPWLIVIIIVIHENMLKILSKSVLSFLIFPLIFFSFKLIISTRTLHLQIWFWIIPIRLILSSYCLVWIFLWTYSIIAGVYNFEQYRNRANWYKKHESFILFLSSISNTMFKKLYFKTPNPDSFLEFPFMPIVFVGHYRILMHTW